MKNTLTFQDVELQQNKQFLEYLNKHSQTQRSVSIYLSLNTNLHVRKLPQNTENDRKYSTKHNLFRFLGIFFSFVVGQNNRHSRG